MFITKGEIREIGIEVISKANTPFVIDTCECQVLDKSNNIIHENVGTIDGHKLLTLLDTTSMDQGDYTIKYIYKIEYETIISKRQIGVID